MAVEREAMFFALIKQTVSRKLATPFIAVFLLLMPSFAAHAGLETEMKKTFQGMASNTTASHKYQNSRRGVITGGSFYARTPLTRERLFHVTPPSFRAGCGGIDLHGGAFSFISIEQFQQMLRNIAQNAAGYVFSLALDAMCPTCNAQMQGMAKTINGLAAGMGNSCEMAKKVVGGIKAAKDEMEKIAAGQALKDGNCDDAAGCGMSNNVFDYSKALGDGLPDGSPAKVNMEVNITWKALQDNQVENWFAGAGATGETNSVKMADILHSMFGTIVYNFSDSDNATATEKAIQPKFMAPTIDDPDVLLTGGQVEIYKCTGIDCLNIGKEDENSAKQTITIVGLRAVVRDFLFGNASSIGLVRKMRMKGSSGDLFTAEEEKFADMTGIIGLLKQFNNDYAAAIMAEHVADVVAYDLAMNMMFDFQGTVKRAIWKLSTNPKLTVELMKPIVDSSFDRIHKLGEKREKAILSAQSSYQVAVPVLDLISRSASGDASSGLSLVMRGGQIQP